MQMNDAHQINETHLGTDATPEQAQRMAERLTAAGWPSEYNSTQGVRTGLRDAETDKTVEIPDAVWQAALKNLCL